MSKQELSMLQSMEMHELHLHFSIEDLALARQRIDALQAALRKAHAEQQWMYTMGKKYLKYYNEDSLEEDWVAAEGYLQLARSMQEYIHWLRGQLPSLTDEVREYKKQWENQTKMSELSKKLTQPKS